MEKQRPKRSSRFRAGRILALLVFLVVLGFGGRWFYHHRRDQNTLRLKTEAETAYAEEDWETAADAQRRIRRTVSEIIRAHGTGDLAIVTHGAVGTLLWCELSGNPIDRQYDQSSQGHYWQASLTTLRPFSTWLPMA